MARPKTDARFDVVFFLKVFIGAAIFLPATLVIKPLGASGAPAELLGLLALAWWFNGRMVHSLGAAYGMNPIRIVTIAFLCVVFASYIAMALQPMSGIEISAADRGVLLILSGAGIALLAADGINSLERLDSLMRFFVTAATFLAGVGALQFFIAFDISKYFHFIPLLKPNSPLEFFYSGAAVRRVAGTATHPIEFGVVLAFALPFALRYAFSAPPGERLFPVGKLLLILLALPMALSRSGALGAVAATSVLVLTWSWERRRTILLMLPVFLVAVRVAAPGLLGSLTSLFASIGQDDSIKHRTNDYSIVGKFISEHPYFGRGFGTFLPQKYFVLDNQYLGTLIEMGFIGLTVLIVFLTTGYFTARGARRRATNPETKDFAQAFAASMAVAIVTFATFDFLGFQMATGILFLLIGCCGALWRLAPLEGKPRLAVAGAANSPAASKGTGAPNGKAAPNGKIGANGKTPVKRKRPPSKPRELSPSDPTRASRRT